MEYWNWGALYDSVLRYDEHLNPIPHLATAFKVSPDGLQITLNLRNDVKFPSGRAFTADDVEYMINLIKQPKAGALYQTFAAEVDTIQKPDPQTVVLQLKQPEAGMLDLLANLYVVDKDNAQNLDRKGVGTGPFAYVDFSPDDHVTFKRNASYWQAGTPYLDQIHVTLGSDPQAIVAQLQAGALDMTTVSANDLVALQQTKKFQVITVPNTMANLWLKVTQKPFDDKRVRQAINYAIDRARFTRVVLKDLSKPTDEPFPPFHWAYFPDLENKYPFNLDKAKSLLAEAGYSKGFDATILAVSTSPENLGLAQILQADLKTIGVNLKIDARDSVSWAQMADAGQFQMLSHTYGRFNSDPSLLFKGTVAWRPINNPTGFKDPQYAKLIDDQAKVIDRSQRTPLIKQLVEYVLDQSFVIPVAPNVTGWVFSPKIKGFDPIAGQVAYMEKVSMG
ncbi:MAG TPA: ABC transporter substrate-binding protein [Chloroflexota bacterium]|nr:ABC transporter substrate-binding protein [Chloroflexota bacterium]